MTTLNQPIRYGKWQIKIVEEESILTYEARHEDFLTGINTTLYIESTDFPLLIEGINQWEEANKKETERRNMIAEMKSAVSMFIRKGDLKPNCVIVPIKWYEQLKSDAGEPLSCFDHRELTIFVVYGAVTECKPTKTYAFPAYNKR